MSPKYTIIPSPPLSELRQFAIWFHQDLHEDYGDFRCQVKVIWLCPAPDAVDFFGIAEGPSSR